MTSNLFDGERLRRVLSNPPLNKFGCVSAADLERWVAEVEACCWLTSINQDMLVYAFDCASERLASNEFDEVARRIEG